MYTVDSAKIQKVFPAYFSNIKLPDAAVEQEIAVYRACPTRKIEKASFLNTYEENGCRVPVGKESDDPQVYCLSTAFRLKDVQRFVIMTSKFQPPFLLAKGHTTCVDGVSCKTSDWKPVTGSHVDWWLYLDAKPWLAFEETTYEHEKEQQNLSKTK